MTLLTTSFFLHIRVEHHLRNKLRLNTALKQQTISLSNNFASEKAMKSSLRMKEVRAQKANIRTFCFEGKVFFGGFVVCKSAKGLNFIEENLSIDAGAVLYFSEGEGEFVWPF